MSQEWQTALQAVLSANGLGFWKWNLNTNQVDCDSECQRILDYDIGELNNQDRSWKQFVHPKDLPRANKVLQDYLANRIPIYKAKLRMLTKFGEWKWILVSGQIYERDQTGKPMLLVGTYKDITKEVCAKLAKKQQTKRENLFRELQTQIISGTSLEIILKFAVEKLQKILQVDRTVICRSQADGSSSVVFESLTDSLSSLKGQNIPVTIPNEVVEKFSTGEQQVLQQCIDIQNVDKSCWYDGQSLINAELSCECFHAELVVPILVPVNQVVSLNSHQEQFAIGQNPASSLTQTGYSLGEYSSLHKTSSHTTSSHTTSSHTTSSHKTSHYCWGMVAIQQYDYCREWQEWEIDTLKQLTKLIAIAIRQQEKTAQAEREIAARKSLEAKLRSQSQQLQTHLEELSSLQVELLENQKMSNLGQLTIDMVSEINKPAGFIHKSLEYADRYIQNLIDFLEDYHHQFSQVKRFSNSNFQSLDIQSSNLQSSNLQASDIQSSNLQASNIQSSNIQDLDLEPVKIEFPNLLWSMGAASDRITDIVGALQTFVHSDTEEIKKFDIHQEINSALKLLQYRLKEQPTRAGIQVVKNFGDLPLVEGYRAELAQVFINIIANAIDTLEERSKQDYSFVPTIWIATNFISNHLSLVENSKSLASVATPLRKHKVILKIADNGQGILPHIQRQIFEPLFTTKTDSKAKGLGLSICQQIVVDKHKGKLKCNSRFGEGSEFVIEINAKFPNLSYGKKNTHFF